MEWTGRTRIFTSMREPNRLVIDMSRSKVNRPRSALRMREKSAAAMLVRTCARAHAEALAVERLNNLCGENCLELVRIRVLAPEVAKQVTTPSHHVHPFPFHRNISFSIFKRYLIKSRFGVLMPFVGFFWNAWTTQTSSASCTE
jgi:hypothetical protein